MENEILICNTEIIICNNKSRQSQKVLMYELRAQILREIRTYY